MALKDPVDPSLLPALVGAVTNYLLERITSIIWSLSADQLGHWARQRALARVVASISGVRLPLREDAEQPGNRMFEFVGRYRERRKKLLIAQRAARRRARALGRDHANTNALDSQVALDEMIYHCKYGYTPAVLPVRRVPPGLRPQPIEYELNSIAQENWQLRNSNVCLKQLETDAIKVLESRLSSRSSDLINAVASEHKALVNLDTQRLRTREALQEVGSLSANVRVAELQKNGLQAALKEKEKEMAVLGAKVARAHMDLAVEQRKNDQQKRKLELVYQKQRQVDLDLVGKLQASNDLLKDQFSKQEAQAKAHQGMCLRLGSHVARLNMEIAELQREFDRGKESLEKQKCAVERQLESEKAKSERLRVLKNEMAKKKRAADARAQTSSRRLERAQQAEESLEDLQAEYDQLHDEMEACVQSVLSLELFDPNTDDTGRFGTYSWRIRLLIYKWLLRRTPPSAVGPNIVDAVQCLAPHAQVRVPGISMIRKMRQEATLIGEAVSAFRIATCKRVVSFGFDETTKMGDSLASINVQIETTEGEVCDEVLRAAFLIPGGCSDQVARAMETKVFSRSRKLLERWKQIYEAKYGTWPGPNPVQLGYHRLAGSLIMSDTCTAARAAKRLIIEMAAAEVEKLAREAGTWDDMSDAEKQKSTTSYVGDCMQHIRNILIDAMANSAASMLKDELQESLEAFAAYERMSTEPMQLIRAVCCSASLDFFFVDAQRLPAGVQRISP